LSSVRAILSGCPDRASGRDHREYWIPAEDLADFNAAIVGRIEVVREFR
jgi:hypothetical protein